MRVVAFLGNAFLLLLPPLLYITSRRSDVGFFILGGYCVIVALASVMALAFRDRFSFWAALGANVVGVLFAAILLIYFSLDRDPNGWAVFFIAVPAALNLLAVLAVRRSRGPSDDTVATRR
jgi:CDP-diglyceride synthetase